MTQQFHEGQEVEVLMSRDHPIARPGLIMWHKAKIECLAGVECTAAKTPCYCVQFPDGMRGVFDAGHIRAIKAKPGGIAGAAQAFEDLF
jgi:hypothetical protein